MLIKEIRKRRAPLHHNPAAVRQAREAREMLQATVAEAAGISAGHLSEIEGGTRNASPELLEQIARVLDCPVTKLERKRQHSCANCGFGYDDAPDSLMPLHTVPGTEEWCPTGGTIVWGTRRRGSAA